MPTYQYSCTECAHFFEIVQSFSDDSLTVCPQCEGRLRKVFNAVGVVFKGSGFYRNDSRGQEPSGDAKAAGKESSTPSEKSPSEKSSPAAKKETSSSSGGAATSASAPAGSA